MYLKILCTIQKLGEPGPEMHQYIFHFWRTRGPSNFRSNTYLIWIYNNCNHLFSFVLITIQFKFGWKPFSRARLTTKCSIVQWFDGEVRSGIYTRRQEKKELHVTLNCKWSLHYCPYIFMDNFQHMGNCGSLHSSQCSNRQKVEKVQAAGWKAKGGKMRKAPDNKL